MACRLGAAVLGDEGRRGVEGDDSSHFAGTGNLQRADLAGDQIQVTVPPSLHQRILVGSLGFNLPSRLAVEEGTRQNDRSQPFGGGTHDHGAASLAGRNGYGDVVNERTISDPHRFGNRDGGRGESRDGGEHGHDGHQKRTEQLHAD